MHDQTKLPRVMFAAPSSGSGKTMITCGILQALKNRGLTVAAFKCGPDYIDPMFHTRVIGTPSRNLDTFFADRQTVRYLFGRQAEKADISVMEGVMGYYDGVAGITEEASSYDLADATDTSVVLIVNARGMSLSLVPFISGFLNYHPESHIRGVLLNQVSGMMYPELKRMIEQALPIRVLGYVPKVPDCVIESRHLGLVMPGEIDNLKERLQKLASVLEETADIDGILDIAQDAPSLNVFMPERLIPYCRTVSPAPRIAVARDEAFCFYYEDNLQLLRDMGAELVEISPLHDRNIPENISGILIGGGYPELYAGQLSQNTAFLNDLRERICSGMPCIAECGGFMYLHETMEDMEHRAWPMAGIIPGKAVKTERLNRFGYIELKANRDQIYGPAGTCIRGHEFHYFDSTCNGDAFHASKPRRKRNWECIVTGDRLAAGFPHLYYYSNPEFAFHFLETCRAFKRGTDNE